MQLFLLNKILIFLMTFEPYGLLVFWLNCSIILFSFFMVEKDLFLSKGALELSIFLSEMFVAALMIGLCSKKMIADLLMCVYHKI